ncbi:MAG: hypothetical protein JNL03_01515 [Prolixibacteraceae bacterium]|nr:hypothetical protein [Prolixibacteraceae bacterium]
MNKTTKLFFLCILMAVTACHRKQSSSGNKTSKYFPAEIVTFCPIEGNPVFEGGTETWDQKIRERGYILYEDGLYKMWYTGYNPEMTRQKFLGYATSADGIQWKRYPGNPIFSEKWTEDMIVVKNEGKYYMFAEGGNDIAHLLISPDGINWKEEGDLTIRSAAGDTIPGPYGTPVVWVEDGKWHLFYERNDLGVWLAESSDKLNWQNVQDEPVLKPGPDKYDIAAVAADQVVKYQEKYFMYYHATDRMDWQHPSSPVIWTSNVAMSTDLVHWTKYPGNPIIEGDHSSPILVFDGKKPSLYTMHSKVWRYNPK